jgi:hypothetical protein
MTGRLLGGAVVVVVGGTVEVVVGAAALVAGFPLDVRVSAPAFWPVAVLGAAVLDCLAAFATAWPAASTEAIADGPAVGEVRVDTAEVGCALAGCSPTTDACTRVTAAAARTATITRRGLILKNCTTHSSHQDGARRAASVPAPPTERPGVIVRLSGAPQPHRHVCWLP